MHHSNTNTVGSIQQQQQQWYVLVFGAIARRQSVQPKVVAKVPHNSIVPLFGDSCGLGVVGRKIQLTGRCTVDILTDGQLYSTNGVKGIPVQRGNSLIPG
jgi:hypothetical protein